MYPSKKNIASIKIEFFSESEIAPTNPKIKVPKTMAIFSVTSKN